MGHMMWRVLSNILCSHDPKVKVKKWVFAMVNHQLQSSFLGKVLMQICSYLFQKYSTKDTSIIPLSMYHHDKSCCTSAIMAEKIILKLAHKFKVLITLLSKKIQASLPVCVDSPQPLLFTYTKYGLGLRPAGYVSMGV